MGLKKFIDKAFEKYEESPELIDFAKGSTMNQAVLGGFIVAVTIITFVWSTRVSNKAIA